MPSSLKTFLGVSLLLACLLDPIASYASTKEALVIYPSGVATWQGHSYRCALGRTGISAQKQEGDGHTPAGTFFIRRGFYRSDALATPNSSISFQAISTQDGWCDEVKNPSYNCYVHLPFSDSHEDLFRADHVYDIILVLSYNDSPVVPGKGSAIFMHIAKEGYKPTAGCVAFSKNDLLDILRDFRPETPVIIRTSWIRSS